MNETSRMQEIFAANVDKLQDLGYFSCNGFYTNDEAQSVRDDLIALDNLEESIFKEHLFQFAGKRYPKPNIYEIDLHDAKLRSQFAILETIFNVVGPNLVKTAHAAFPALELDPTSASAIKVQLNKGGSFPCHYDNPGPPNTRRLTCIVYLNPEWNDSLGGELELMPFLKKKVTIQPLMNTLVLFRSDLVLHGVSPWKIPTQNQASSRLCFTVWIDSLTQGAFKLTREHLQFTSWDNAVLFFQTSTLQRCISRAVYAEEYEETLVRCVGGTSAEEPMLTQHHAHVKILQGQLKPLIEEMKRRKEKLV